MRGVQAVQPVLGGGGGTGTVSAVVQGVGKITERLTVSETFKILSILSDTKLH